MMKTNLVEKTVTKWKLWTIILSAIIFVGIVLSAIFGFNAPIDLKSAEVVSVDYSAVYVARTSVVTDACDGAFKKSEVKPIKSIVASDVTDGEVIYYFAKGTDLTAAVDVLKADVAEATGADIVKVKVNVWTEDFVKGATEGYIWRAALATTVFAVLAFVYVSLRYKLSMGITMAAALVATGATTVAFVGGTRIPVTPSLAYAAIFAMLLTVVLLLLTFNRMRDNAKDKDAQKELSAEQKVVAAVDLTKMAIFAGALTVGVVLLGVLVSTARWFALTALIGVLVAVFVAVAFAPALLVVLETAIKSGEKKPLFKIKKKEKAEDAQEESVQEVAEDAQAE